VLSLKRASQIVLIRTRRRDNSQVHAQFPSSLRDQNCLSSMLNGRKKEEEEGNQPSSTSPRRKRSSSAGAAGDRSVRDSSHLSLRLSSNGYASEPQLTLAIRMRTLAANVGTFSGLALWLSPSPSSPSSTSLTNLINTLSTTHSTPSFSPHVTLLTGIPTSASVPELIASLDSAIRRANPTSPLQLSFTHLGTHHTFFQYLFAAVDPAPPLVALRSLVRSTLLPQLDGTLDNYFPHFSLMYGVDTEERKVARIIEGLEQQEQRNVGAGEGFEASEVSVVKCEGPPTEWQVVGKVSLVP
jgi:hypothetical protein